jgi:hypothetical protein
MLTNEHEREILRRFIERETKPLLDRVEKLEAEQVKQRGPVGWGGHLPGKIEP